LGMLELELGVLVSSAEALVVSLLVEFDFFILIDQLIPGLDSILFKSVLL
jgi:hypothetical protein